MYFDSIVQSPSLRSPPHRRNSREIVLSHSRKTQGKFIRLPWFSGMLKLCTTYSSETENLKGLIVHDSDSETQDDKKAAVPKDDVFEPSSGSEKGLVFWDGPCVVFSIVNCRVCLIFFWFAAKIIRRKRMLAAIPCILKITLRGMMLIYMFCRLLLPTWASVTPRRKLTSVFRRWRRIVCSSTLTLIASPSCTLYSMLSIINLWYYIPARSVSVSTYQSVGVDGINYSAIVQEYFRDNRIQRYASSFVVIT